MIVVVAYDIADDGRREDVSSLLSGYGPRVQLSVFECQLTARKELRALLAKVREIVDIEADQVRFYPLAQGQEREVVIVGARQIEERQDYWII